MGGDLRGHLVQPIHDLGQGGLVGRVEVGVGRDRHDGHLAVGLRPDERLGEQGRLVAGCARRQERAVVVVDLAGQGGQRPDAHDRPDDPDDHDQPAEADDDSAEPVEESGHASILAAGGARSLTRWWRAEVRAVGVRHRAGVSETAVHPTRLATDTGTAEAHADRRGPTGPSGCARCGGRPRRRDPSAGAWTPGPERCPVATGRRVRAYPVDSGSGEPMDLHDRTDPDRFAQRLFTPLPRRYDRLAELLSMGQNGRWRQAMVDHIVPARPARVLDVACGPAGVTLQLARRTGAEVVGIDITEEMLRQGQRNVAEADLSGRIQFVIGRGQDLPFPDATFDALTFTYLLRYVDDPARTLRELARVVKPGAPVASLEFFVPPNPFWHFWWLGYTRLVLPVGGWITGGRGVVRRWPFPRSQHLGSLPPLSGPLDRRGLATGRHRRDRDAGHEPRRWSRDVGDPDRWVNRAPPAGAVTPSPVTATTGDAPALGLPAYYAARPGGWRDWWTLLHPPYTAWHLGYVVIGACLAPQVNAVRLVATLLAFFFAVGLAAHALDELHGRPLRTKIPTSALVAVSVVGLAGAVTLGIAGVVQVGWVLIPFLVVGPLLVVGYNAELFGGLFHNDVTFGLALGRLPGADGLCGSDRAPGVRPTDCRGGGRRPFHRPAPAEHAGPHVAPADEWRPRHGRHGRRLQRPAQPAGPVGAARARPPGHVVVGRAAGDGAGRRPAHVSSNGTSWRRRRPGTDRSRNPPRLVETPGLVWCHQTMSSVDDIV